jgi:hypothetical protein
MTERRRHRPGARGVLLAARAKEPTVRDPRLNAHGLFLEIDASTEAVSTHRRRLEMRAQWEIPPEHLAAEAQALGLTHELPEDVVRGTKIRGWHEFLTPREAGVVPGLAEDDDG